MARKPVTVSLPEDLVRETSQYCKRRSVTMSEIVRDAVRDYLFVHRFRALRAKMVPKAKKHGIYSDQDVFDRIS